MNANRMMEEFEEFWSAEDYYSAYARLESIVAIRHDPMFSSAVRALIQRARPDSPIIDAVVSEMRRDIDRIEHILSIGEEYNVDERLLILGQADKVVSVSRLLATQYRVEIPIETGELVALIQKKLDRYEERGVAGRLYSRLSR